MNRTPPLRSLLCLVLTGAFVTACTDRQAQATTDPPRYGSLAADPYRQLNVTRLDVTAEDDPGVYVGVGGNGSAGFGVPVGGGSSLSYSLGDGHQRLRVTKETYDVLLKFLYARAQQRQLRVAPDAQGLTVLQPQEGVPICYTASALRAASVVPCPDLKAARRVVLRAVEAGTPLLRLGRLTDQSGASFDVPAESAGGLVRLLEARHRITSGGTVTGPASTAPAVCLLPYPQGPDAAYGTYYLPDTTC